MGAGGVHAASKAAFVFPGWRAGAPEQARREGEGSGNPQKRGHPSQ